MQRLLRTMLEHARLVSLLGLLGAAGWAFVAWMTLDMGHPLIVLMMPTSAAWEPQTIVAVLIMWALMMVAMMLPSAAPMVATFDGLQKRKSEAGVEGWRTSAFVAGYLMVWVGFSVLATALQWLLQAMALVTPMAESVSPLLTSGLLAIAGLYQFSPLKQMCLRYCRSPIGFLLMEWRPGVARGVGDGPQARRLLPWLLLGRDAAAVRGRRDEPDLDRRAHRGRGGGEAGTVRDVDLRPDGRGIPGGEPRVLLLGIGRATAMRGV